MGLAEKVVGQLLGSFHGQTHSTPLLRTKKEGVYTTVWEIPVPNLPDAARLGCARTVAARMQWNLEWLSSKNT